MVDESLHSTTTHEPRSGLSAADCGLLDLTWSVLCPVCRTVREDSGRLRQLPSRVHCDTCDIAFDTDLARSVEIRFAVNPAVRRAERARYCIGGPANSPSVVAQLRLEPGAAVRAARPRRRVAAAALLPGGQLGVLRRRLRRCGAEG